MLDNEFFLFSLFTRHKLPFTKKKLALLQVFFKQNIGSFLFKICLLWNTAQFRVRWSTSGSNKVITILKGLNKTQDIKRYSFISYLLNRQPFAFTASSVMFSQCSFHWHFSLFTPTIHIFIIHMLVSLTHCDLKLKIIHLKLLLVIAI